LSQQEEINSKNVGYQFHSNFFLFLVSPFFLPQGYTRVYLLCEVQISRALPKFIVDYAADRAMPRATTWLRPEVEASAAEWLEVL
jgi:hypothetical protein